MYFVAACVFLSLDKQIQMSERKSKRKASAKADSAAVVKKSKNFSESAAASISERKSDRKQSKGKTSDSSDSSSTSDLWRCPHCSRPFANVNQSHSCIEKQSQSPEVLLKGKGDTTRALFDAFQQAVNEHGSTVVIASKTRIGFQVRMIFAAIMPRVGYLRGHLILAERVQDERFVRVTSLSKQNHVHEFELRSEEQLDKRFRELIGAAYRVGQQKHIGKGSIDRNDSGSTSKRSRKS